MMRIGGWCDFLSQNNAAALIMSDAVEESATRAYTSVLANKAATIFAMADRNADAGYAMGFGLSATELASLPIIDGAAHQVLQKRGEETVVLKTNLDALPPTLFEVLAGHAPGVTDPADTLAQLMGYHKQPA